MQASVEFSLAVWHQILAHPASHCCHWPSAGHAWCFKLLPARSSTLTLSLSLCLATHSVSVIQWMCWGTHSSLTRQGSCKCTHLMEESWDWNHSVESCDRLDCVGAGKTRYRRRPNHQPLVCLFCSNVLSLKHSVMDILLLHFTL